MILQALNNYYERLKADPHIDVATFGFSQQKISFCVVLNADGTLHEIVAESDGNADSPRPKLMTMPGGAKPPGSAITPCFLWDNTGYMLGFKPDDDNPKRTKQSFQAFRKRHVDLANSIACTEFQAVCDFLSCWNPDQAEEHEILVGTVNGFGVFRIHGQSHYVHERPEIQEWWSQQLGSSTTEKKVIGQCLLTGETAPLARIHEPRIKGVAATQSFGASLVSFNDTAYESFGRSQNFNAPVGETAAFQYSTALNQLLRPEHGRRFQIGDATTVFWAESPSPIEDLFGSIVDPGQVPSDDENKTARLRKLIHRIVAGEDVSTLGIGEAETRFYVLGLSPNAARISVRFWYISTLKELVISLRRHLSDFEIVSSEKCQYPAVWKILRETARESKDISPLLSGALMRSILAGTAYPQMILTAVVRRIRAEREVHSVRAAIIKAVLNRNSRLGIFSLSREITMSLDSERPEVSYQLGRLFAELEVVQQDALSGSQQMIRNRHFAAASATPSSVFPRIIRLCQHHLSQMEYGLKLHREEQIQEICGRFAEFPAHLNLNEQGLFALGYYHQRQAIFTKKRQPVEAIA